MSNILIIPVDRNANKLFIKNFHTMNNRMFCNYKSTFNDIPFQETELFFADNNKNVIICGEDGTVLWRFNYESLKSI
jgi:hypothetical protein